MHAISYNRVFFSNVANFFTNIEFILFYRNLNVFFTFSFLYVKFISIFIKIKNLKSGLNPHISVDCVIFGFDIESLKVLLVEREIKNSRSGETISVDLKLPGDLVRNDEDLDTSAYRVLKELTGLDNIYLKQFHVFSDPYRINNSKDINWLITTTNLSIERVITVGYYSLVKIDESNLNPTSSEYNYKWFKINNIPKLAFDHNKIIVRALESLQLELKTEPVCFELLPEKFTKNQLQKVYEVILNVKLDNRNFRKKISRLDYIIPLYEKQSGVNHKPAQLYKFDKTKYKTVHKNNADFLI